MTYLKTPPEIYRIISLFSANDLSYCLFKCEHIFAGENSNLDILFQTDEDYQKARQLLVKEGYSLYLSEKIERYKSMYLKIEDNNLTKIHLHRRIAWHGLIAIDHDLIFQKLISPTRQIRVPSPEDSLLIHLAHALFENFQVSQPHLDLIKSLLSSNLNQDYLNHQLKGLFWKKEFFGLLKRIKNLPVHQKILIIPKSLILSVYLKSSLSGHLPVVHLLSKAFQSISRKISLRRRGTLIALVGVNGSGKTTLAHNLQRDLSPLAKFLHVRSIYYYFGWKPFTPWAKIISFLLKDKKTFRQLTEKDDIAKKDEIKNGDSTVTVKEKTEVKFSFFHEAIFCYNYLEYLARYIFQVYPRLRKGDIIVSDRYFYDLYGQYPYSSHSRTIRLLISLFPRPDKTCILDTDISSLLSRKKTSNQRQISDQERRIKPTAYLYEQKSLYAGLSKIIPSKKIYTGNILSEQISLQIVSSSWKKIVSNQQ
jgi:thymidylate kinase